jgi:cysteine-rich repeat protein
VWAGVETCDDGNQNNNDQCPLSCVPAYCGDGYRLNGIEQCDDGNQSDDDFCNTDCTSNGYYDDFESNDLMTLPWLTNGNNVWATNNVQPHEGLYGAASGNIGHSQQTHLELTIDVPAGSVSFWYRVSSEQGFDYLRFYIDNIQQGLWSGNVAWAQTQYNFAAGLHTFRWSYTKDGSVVAGSDKVWIDEVYVGLAP